MMAKPRAKTTTANDAITPVKDEALLTALAGGATIETAADKAGVSRSTAHRRLKAPEFQQRLRETRRDILQRAVAFLGAAAGEASKTLVLLLGSGYTSTTRLG